jgi:glucose dehydrogenase
MIVSGVFSSIGVVAAISDNANTSAAHPVATRSTMDSGHVRYSPLTQITPKNVNDLKPVWVYDTGSKGRSWEGMPIVVDGVMYSSIPGAAVALDPETGKQIWKFTPVEVRPGRDRGVSYWPGDADTPPRIIYAITDRLYALDAKTGKPIPTFGTDGLVHLRDEVSDKYPTALYTVSSPAAIYKNLAIVSPSTQEFGSKGPSGDPRAFDIKTGKLVWRFHTVPHPGEFGNDSWGPNGWQERAGPSAWGGVSIDEKLGLAFVPIGNPDDSFNGIDRPGNNYYANSIIALDAATGKLKWFFQMTHHDVLDYDAASAPTFIDVKRNGQVIPALVEVPKSGLAFVLDRRTGKPVFGVQERPVPQSDLPGEHTSPTQPFPIKPEPMARQGMTRDDIATITPELHDFCTALWDKQEMHNSGPYSPVTLKGTTVALPGTSGGGNWGGWSFNPGIGYFFVNVSNVPTIAKMIPDGAGGYKLQGAYTRFGDTKGTPCVKPPWGELIAVNANTGDVAWRSPLGSADELGPLGTNAGTSTLGGSVTTASGLVFIGATVDPHFRAFDARTGKLIWTTFVPSSAIATPITYMAKNGRQYVVIASGGPGVAGFGRGGSSRQVLVAYALPLFGETDLDLSVYATPPTSATLPTAAGNAAQTQAPRTQDSRATSSAANANAPPPAKNASGEVLLPEGPGRDDVRSMCGACHGVDTAVAVRRTSDGWKDLIQDMRVRGAQGDEAKVARVHDYLTRYFGVIPTPADPTVAPK